MNYRQMAAFGKRSLEHVRPFGLDFCWSASERKRVEADINACPLTSTSGVASGAWRWPDLTNRFQLGFLIDTVLAEPPEPEHAAYQQEHYPIDWFGKPRRF